MIAVNDGKLLRGSIRGMGEFRLNQPKKIVAEVNKHYLG
jgi:hypothetical protein